MQPDYINLAAYIYYFMKIYLFFIYLLLSCYCKAQNSKNIHFIYKDKTDLNVPVSERITYCHFQSIFYYCKNEYDTIVNNHYFLKIYTFDMDIKQRDSFFLSIPATESLLQWSISSITVNDSRIAVAIDSVYIFDRSRKLLCIVESKNSEEIIVVNNNRLLMLKNYNSHPLDDSVKTKIMSYNYEKSNIELYIKPDFKYIGYTHFVRNFFSVSSKLLAFAQAMPYKINIYSKKNLKVIDSIFSQDLINSDSLISSIELVHSRQRKEHSAKKMYYELKTIDSNISRIEKIHFLNDSTLLVSKKLPGSKFEKRHIDVWQYLRGSWERVVVNQLYQTELPNGDDFVITPSTFPINLTYSGKILTSGRQILLIDTKVPPININNKEIGKFHDDYYSDNELNYFLTVFEWDVK